MQIPDGLFKAYDIRGAGVTPELAEAVGLALAQWLPAGPMAVGFDVRRDSPELARAFAKGAAAGGREIWNIGLVTTDMVSFAVGHFKLAGGAMITASHNPGSDNGIKVFGPGAAPVGSESGLAEIQKLVEGEQKPAATPGEVKSRLITHDWAEYLLSLVDVSKIKPFNVVIDAGNGSAGSVWPLLLEKLPIKAEALYFEPDDTFPHHPANPVLPENQVDLVRRMQTRLFDLGLAFDADGDRMVAVDETGTAITGSIMSALLVPEVLRAHPGSAVVYSVPCSKIVADTISAGGGKPVRSRSGHAFIKEQMRANNAAFGAEESGHYYFEEYFSADSGSLAALKLLEIMSQSDQKLSEIAKPYYKYFDSGEINLTVDDREASIERVAAAYPDGQHDRLDGLTVDYGDWWFNLRASNTEPLVRLNIEATSQQLLDTNLQKIQHAVRHSA